MSSETHFVFVYGTLRRGASNAFRMEGAEFVDDAFVRGRLYRVDWYPAIVLSPESGRVKGELWRVASAQLAELDQFEGDEYRRVEAQVYRGNADDYDQGWGKGRQLAWIWEWQGSVDQLEFLLTGDWMDVESPRPPKVLTCMGCLSLIAMPIGGAVIWEFVRDLFGWSALYSGAFTFLVLIGTPILALFLVRCADRRRELGKGWRELAVAISVVWIVVAGILLLAKGLELIPTR